MRHKSRENGISLGDKNTIFFYIKCISSNFRNQILRLKDSNGEVLQGHEAVQKEVVKYYTNLIDTKIRDDGPDSGLETLQQIVLRKIEAEDAVKLVKRVCLEEIKKTLFLMEGGKSPGPDGFNLAFFKENCDIVGSDVSKGVLEFFKNKRMIK